MNFKFYVEKLNDSEEYKKFLKENKGAFPVSAFFIIDKKSGDNKQHFDYFIPSQEKMFSFKLEDECKKVPVEVADKSKLKKENEISLDRFDFDFGKIEKMIEAEMFDKKIKKDIHKLLLSIQNKDEKQFILATVFISNMGLLKVTIDLENMKILDFEKKSLLDMFKIKKNKKSK